MTSGNRRGRGPVACRGPCGHLPTDVVLHRLPALPGLAGPAYGRAAWIVACPIRGRAIAAAYRCGPGWTDGALPAYRAFRAETSIQFDQLTASRAHGGLGIDVQTSCDDPYPDAAAMAADVLGNNRLRVYATGGPGNHHPLLSTDDNNMFRAVHDVFGHLASGRGFDRHGEDAAWFAHSQRYSALARRAMTTETRGQSSAFIWQHQGRRFPDQKVLLLPARFCDPEQISLRGRTLSTLDRLSEWSRPIEE
jgi:hypothetical protein